MSCFCCPSANWRFIKTQNENYSGQIFHSLLDEQTKDLYIDDPIWLVAVKCFFVFIGTPLYTGAVMIGYVVTALVDLCHWQIAEVGKDLLQVLRSPFHGFVLGLSALYGIVNPFEGRKFAAFTMQSWSVGSKGSELYLAPCFIPRVRLEGKITEKET